MNTNKSSTNHTTKILITLFPMILQIGYWGMLKLMVPVLPNLDTVFAVSTRDISTMVSLSFILSGCSSIIWGALIENRSNTAIMSAVVSSGIVALTITATTNTFWVFCIFYITSCIITNVFSIYSRHFPMMYLRDPAAIKQSITLRLSGGYFATFFAPFLGGIISKYWGWRYSFLVIIIWLIIIYIISKNIGDPNIKYEDSTFWQTLTNSFSHLKNRRFRRNLAILSCGNAITQSYVVSIPFWLERTYHITADKIAFYYILPVLLPGIIAPLIPGYIAQHHNNDKIRIILYMTIFSIAGILPFVAIMPNRLPAFFWIIPGLLSNISMVALTPIISYNAFFQIKTAQNSASSLFSMCSYLSGGCAMYITLHHININNFYLEGVLILFMAIIMCYNFIAINRDLRRVT